MGKANAHLNGGKAPAWSCVAFFLILVLCVHLIPYIPSHSSSLCLKAPEKIPVSNPNPDDEFAPLHSDTCLSFLHSIDYNGSVECKTKPCKNNSWDWSVHNGRIVECQFRRFDRFDASALINGSWILVAGDSQTRLLYFSVLDIFVPPEEIEATKRRFYEHGNYTTTVEDIGLKMDFIWAPHALFLRQIISDLNKEAKHPNLIVMGAGLWDVMHVGDLRHYRDSLKAFRETSATLFGGGDADLRGAFWVAMPTLFNWKLTVLKKDMLRKERCRAYDEALKESKICRQSGGPMFRVDLLVLSDLCGEKCTLDGLHYDRVVYESACQIMFNALSVQSNPKLLHS